MNRPELCKHSTHPSTGARRPEDLLCRFTKNVGSGGKIWWFPKGSGCAELSCKTCTHFAADTKETV